MTLIFRRRRRRWDGYWKVEGVVIDGIRARRETVGSHFSLSPAAQQMRDILRYSYVAAAARKNSWNPEDPYFANRGRRVFLCASALPQWIHSFIRSLPSMGFIIDIVTGSSQGIGRAIAESIAHHRALELADARSAPPYALFLVGRNNVRGSTAARNIQNAVGGSFPVYFEPCDLSDYNSVLDLKGRIGHRLLDANNGDVSSSEGFQVGVLVNDAAECPVQQELVVRPRKDEKHEGAILSEHIDKQFATNVLGYHFMMKVFEPNFSREISLNDDAGTTKPTHIVNVASNWAGDLDFSDLHFKRRSYDNDTAYRQSKQCDRMLTKIWSEKLASVALVNSCHPGDPCTTLSKALGYNMWSSAPTKKMIDSESPIPFLCGFGSIPLTTTGGWFDGRATSPMRCRFGSMTKDNKHLFDICETFAVSK